MVERIRAYFEKLEALSIEELDSSVEKLARVEKRHSALVIAHIAEMSRRKGAIERGYKNLFDYCVRRLNLSEGSVALRTQVANVARRFPQLLVAIAENRLSLTVAGLLAPHLSDDNVDGLIGDCAGMTKRAAEEYLVGLRPKPVFRPSVRKVPWQPAEPEQNAASTEPQRREDPRPVEPPQPPPAPRPLVQPATPEQFNFRFSAGKEFKEKLERLAEVLGKEIAHRHMAEVLERALDDALDKRDPKRRLERRQARAGKQGAKSRPDEIFGKDEKAESRHVPARVRERVHARAGYRCEYRGAGGARCTARAGLTIEHVRPFALYGSHDERFLRLYCRQHNRLSAERVYGAAFIQSRIAASRKQTEERTT